ncbi:MAG TPA: acyl carrier protein [Thermodesulfovibrionales bacterium]|nr:acyl carrier protein [Thermodesulfovibrionales bacterium]
MTTYEKIKKLFVDSLGLNEEALKPEATLDSLGLDSLDRIEFMFVLEDEFKIKIPDREVKITTIQDMVDAIDRLIVEQHAV